MPSTPQPSSLIASIARARIAATGLGLAAAFALSSVAAAQGGRTKVSYDVVFSTGGGAGTYCPSTGADSLTGTLVGLEPAAPGDDNEYVGNLHRSTRVSVCDVKRKANGEDAVCNFDIVGNGYFDVVLKVYADQRGAWLQYTDRASWAALIPPAHAGPQLSTVNGTCDPNDMVEMQNAYDQGETAGSPNGQPLEVSGLPPSGPYPFTFPANPPKTVWTLKILARRP